ncbi:MAG: thiol:disulfide interchange protein [Proteobacteria bacterium]|nr:MAG: thiol:disulfide interchange protein [Pseudomonadota bacterium]
MRTILKITGAAALLLSISACAPSASQLKSVLEEHPEILTGAIEKHPEQFMEALQKASEAAQAKAEAAKMEELFKNPLNPEVIEARGFLGDAKAPLTIVEYTDFQCPYCSKGYETLEEVRKAYGDKVRVLVKNLPLPMHPQAMPAAQYFEALRLQDPAKAYAFYHEVFANQDGLNKDKEKFLDAAATKAGGNLAQLKKDIKGPKVKEAIAADMKEAESFEIQGTPGFVVGGIPLRGAYPLPFFKQIIDRRLANK